MQSVRVLPYSSRQKTHDTHTLWLDLSAGLTENWKILGQSTSRVGTSLNYGINVQN